MLRDISLHILDLTQNSISAGASEIRIDVASDAENERLSVRIEDKARAAVQCYLALDEGDRVRGTINVVEQNTGTVVANWSSSSAAA